MIGKMFVLLFIFQIKHYLADYPLQNEYMLGKFKEKGWFLPLAAHAGVHALFTFLISILFVAQWDIFHAGILAFPRVSLFSVCFVIALFDFIVHFTMDRIKASPKMMGKHKAINEFEYYYLKGKIEKAVEAEAIYDCSQAEDLLNERMKSNKKFWRSLGIDQMVHHLTHYAIILILI